MSHEARTDRLPISRILIGVSAWLVGTLPFLVQLHSGRTSSTLEHYLDSARAVLDGSGIYTNVFFEYPPYALAWFVGPAAITAELPGFRLVFGLLIWALDAVVKAVLVWLGCRRRDRGVDLLPFLLYSLATAAAARIILQRFDVIPAALSLVAIVLLTRGWPLAAGIAIAVAAGTKLFPVLYVPIMMAFAWRRGPRDFSRLLVGGVIGVVPLFAIAWLVPWWKFLGVHAQRGLEAGSVWASVIWLGHSLGLPAKWEFVTDWMEVTGPVAAGLVAPARVVWIGATLAGLGVAVWAALRGPWATSARAGTPDPGWLPALVVLLLLPATAFVAFSPVLSPQFHLWLAPWSALALLARDRRDLVTGTTGVRRAVACLFLATFLVPVFYPSQAFATGLDLGRTIVLVVRNALLIYAAWSLAKAVVGFHRPDARRRPGQGE